MYNYVDNRQNIFLLTLYSSIFSSSSFLSAASAMRSNHFASLVSHMSAIPISHVHSFVGSHNSPHTRLRNLHPNRLPRPLLIHPTRQLLPLHALHPLRQHMSTHQSICIICPLQSRLRWFFQVDVFQPDGYQRGIQSGGELDGEVLGERGGEIERVGADVVLDDGGVPDVVQVERMGGEIYRDGIAATKEMFCVKWLVDVA